MGKGRGCHLCEDHRFHGKPSGLIPLLKAHSSLLPRDRIKVLSVASQTLAFPLQCPPLGQTPAQVPAVSESEEHDFPLPCAWDFALPGPSPLSPLPGFTDILLLKAYLSPQALVRAHCSLGPYPHRVRDLTLSLQSTHSCQRPVSSRVKSPLSSYLPLFPSLCLSFSLSGTVSCYFCVSRMSIMSVHKDIKVGKRRVGS